MKLHHHFLTNLPALSHAVKPVGLSSPSLVAYNSPLADAIGLGELSAHPDFLAILSGNALLPNTTPIAQKYTGHQFGHYNPDLGDGRGLLLAEVENELGQCVDLHLKGAGKTPFSRFGDGRAVLRSSIREYLASEALHHLGVPTTRALSLITSPDTAMRAEPEPCAMLIRVTQSHIRFGHFEYCFYHAKSELPKLMDYVIKQLYPHCLESDEPYLALLQQIIVQTAEMIAHWQAIGFTHGVMNTDNMSVLGQTFDYGPYGFLDDYQVDFVANTTDTGGRYAFDNQPSVALWNLNALAHCFSDVLSKQQISHALGLFERHLQASYSTKMCHKMGFSEQKDGDLALIGEFLGILAEQRADYTLSFRALADFDLQKGHPELAKTLAGKCDESRLRFERFCTRYTARLLAEDESWRTRIQSNNPQVILRNYHLQTVIDAAMQGDFSVFDTYLTRLKTPFDACWQDDTFAKAPPTEGKQMPLSCSS